MPNFVLFIHRCGVRRIYSPKQTDLPEYRRMSRRSIYPPYPQKEAFRDTGDVD